MAPTNIKTVHQTSLLHISHREQPRSTWILKEIVAQYRIGNHVLGTYITKRFDIFPPDWDAFRFFFKQSYKFMAKWIVAEKTKAGLRHAVLCPNVTGRTKERIDQSKRARAGSIALVD